jgi:hypothetical protein
MTNTGIQTQINNGDIGTIATGTTSITGFHDSPPSDVYTETPATIGAVSGKIFTCTTSTTGPTNPVAIAPLTANPVSCGIATQGRLDAQAAFIAMAALPSTGPAAANLAGLTLTPGVYTNATSVSITGTGAINDLTLDGQGNADAVWVFQIGSTLTVGGAALADSRSVNLINGAQAKNVFWQVGTAATINPAGGGTMVGTIISNSGVAFSTVGNTTIVTLNGRAQSLVASVTLVDTVINVPAP